MCEEKIEIPFDSHVDSLILRFTDTLNDLKTLISEMKILKKEHNKAIKKLNGNKKITKDPSAPKKLPSGFCKPRKISAELAKFLNIEENMELSSPEVTKLITNYIRKNNLQKKEDNRVIDLDKPGGEELRKLLKIPVNEELSFFNLQHFTKNHFIEEPVSKEE